MHRMVILLILLFTPVVASAQLQLDDPLDPNDLPFKNEEELLDEQKSADELILDAEMLFIDERPLDARTKLLLALKKDPNNYQAHSLLAGYYLVHVGHFRLSLRYIRQAQTLFEKEYGPPPYSDFELKNTHAHHIHLLSQARLNLDDYNGALAALDEYERHGYYKDWYPGSRAWILMKNGKLQEAIRVARVGLLANAETGRTLNILGILLSMTGQRQQSLQVFRQAIAHEYSLGPYGQPATPLNNSGEVYREIFDENAAEKAWLQATSLPDGCEHVLPALNLSTVLLERLDFSGAKRAIDNFETCVAQYPLRNGEEHRALVHLARGRIHFHSGRIDEGITHLREAERRKQWFGKIGTDVEDLQAGLLSSLALALEQKAGRMSLSPSFNDSIYQKTKSLIEKIGLQFEAWWLRRRTRKLLIDKLQFGEDLYVRNTDSLLEYSFLGSLFSGMPERTFQRRVQFERQADNRGPAGNYYDAYLGENLLYQGEETEGLNLLRQVLSRLRLPADAALKVHVHLRMASTLPSATREYRSLAEEAFLLNRAALPGYGVRLPVNFSSAESALGVILKDSPFLIDNSQQLDFVISHGYEAEEHSLRLSSRSGRSRSFTVNGRDLDKVLDKLIEEVFQLSSA